MDVETTATERSDELQREMAALLDSDAQSKRDLRRRRSVLRIVSQDVKEVEVYRARLLNRIRLTAESIASLQPDVAKETEAAEAKKKRELDAWLFANPKGKKAKPGDGNEGSGG